MYETVKDYINAIDQIIEGAIGVSVHDLPDFRFTDAWESGEPPIDAAWEILDNEGLYDIANALYD